MPLECDKHFKHQNLCELVVFLYRLSISSRERDDDEGVPSENEEDRRLHEIKVKELRGTEFHLPFFL